MKVAVRVAGLFLSSWTCMILKTACCTFLSIPFSIMHAQELGERSDPLRGMGLGWACKTGLGVETTYYSSEHIMNMTISCFVG